MHLVVCLTAKKLPLPARLPKCLRQPPSNQQPSLQESQQQRQPPQGEPAAEKKEKGKESLKQQEKGPGETTTKDQQPGAPVDLKRATKEFKHRGMEAEEFLPVLQVGLTCPACLFFGKALSCLCYR